MDIPIFYANTGSADLYLSNKQIVKDFFKEPSFDTVISGIENLYEDDLKNQILFIENSFAED